MSLCSTHSGYTVPVALPIKQLQAVPLTAKQRAFVTEYLRERNGVAAARAAGYRGNDNALAVRASELVRNRKVLAAIDAYILPALEKAGVTAEGVINSLAEIADSDIAEIMDFSGNDWKLKTASEISPKARRTLSKLRVRQSWKGSGDNRRQVETFEICLWDKVSALVKLGEYFGLWKQSQGVQVNSAHAHLHLTKDMPIEECTRTLVEYLRSRPQ